MPNESLTAQFEALHAERELSWSPEQLQKNINQRQWLVDRYDPKAHIRPGETIPYFELDSITGGTVTRDTLIAHGPAVLIFFRFAGCPACNLALPYYDRQLWQALKAANIPLVAISPQPPGPLGEIGRRHGLGFTIASDPNNRLGRTIGITFEPEEKPAVAVGENWIGALPGTNSWELPQPTVLILNSDATVRFVEVSPDWLHRTEAPAILDALPELRAAA